MTRAVLVVALCAAGACSALVDIDRSRLETKRCATNGDCDDGLFCNGAESCIAHTCISGDDPCSDGVACTTDRCTEATHECRHEESDERCPQDSFPQRCDAEDGCRPVEEGA